MVFVLQQSDRASERELQVNREYVRAYAGERQVADPVIFTLSAKQELEGNPESGYGEFRAYLQNAVARGDVWRMKVEGAYETVRGVMKKLLDQLQTEQHALSSERAFYLELLEQVQAREAKAASLKQLMIGKMAAAYDELARRSEDEFTEGLGVRKLLRRVLPFRRQETNETWMDDLKVRFLQSARKEINGQARRVSSELSQEIEAMLQELRQRILRRQETFKERAALPQTAANLKFLEQVQTRLDRIQINQQPIASSNADDTAELSRLAIAGGGLAVIGVVLAALTQNAWLDLFGGSFAVIGVLLIGAGLLWRRSEMLREFRRKLGVSRQEFHARLETEFEQVFEGLFAELHQALSDAIFRLDLQAFHLKPTAQETFALGEAAGEQLLHFQRTLAPQAPAPSVTPMMSTGSAAA
jgi:hypothetical protein